ncbi:hypothetical protein C0V76_06030 [Uliginosibacterium sp. TH139]|nr:hypothetical protein C0V76_06030 [Uliginosibacterium sp. TH139]
MPAQARFAGTDNPRHLRAIHALLRRPMPREQLDREAGCSNGPELVAELRRRGLDVPCTKTPVIDRDGQEVRRGIYHLTEQDRRKVYRWQGSRHRGAGQSGNEA